MDDLFGGAKTWGHAAYQQLFCMIVGALMGIEFHPEKIDPPDFIQKILGYLYNCKTKTIGIDKEKNEKFFALCRKLAMTKGRFSIRKPYREFWGKLFGMVAQYQNCGVT